MNEKLLNGFNSIKTATISLFILIFFQFLLSGADLNITLKKENGDIKIQLEPEGGLDMGSTAPDKKKSFALLFKNISDEKILLEGWRSPCTCLKFSESIDELDAGKEAEITVTLDGENYRGKFSKFMYLSLSDEKKKVKKDFFLPFKFSVLSEGEKEDKPVSAPVNALANFKEYEGGGFDKYPDAIAWIFAGKSCPGCNFLKSSLMPVLIEKEGISGAKVIIVNLDVKEYFLFMMELEDKLKTKGDKTPVLYWKGKLYYGNEAIKKLIDGR